MRHLLLALLIALLPLRAWVGDAMAVSMLGHSAGAVVAATGTEAQADCPEHAGQPPANLPSAAHAMQAHPADAPHPGDGADQDHHTHSACDVCNGPALVMGSFGAVAAAQTHTPLTPLADRFASVAPQQGIKPPIA